jgi:hypothetical protein
MRGTPGFDRRWRRARVVFEAGFIIRDRIGGQHPRLLFLRYSQVPARRGFLERHYEERE